MNVPLLANDTSSTIRSLVLVHNSICSALIGTFWLIYTAACVVSPLIVAATPVKAVTTMVLELKSTPSTNDTLV